MNFVEFRNWLMEKFKEWERTQPNGRSNYSNFARFLGISVNVYSQWRIGNNLPSYKNAVAIAEKLNDYTIMDILGYERPDVGGSVPKGSYKIPARKRIFTWRLSVYP